MSEIRQHPAPEQLDRLRAGLLENAADTVAKLERHIRDCLQCRDYLAGWERLQALAQADRDQGQLAARLQTARKAALRSPAPAWRRPLQPVLGAAAGLMLVAGLVLWQPWSPVVISPDQVAQHLEETGPDLYEDLDFYIWLAGHEESSASTEIETIAYT